LKFLFELNWRLEKYLFPILNDWAKFYEQVLSRYSPFSDKAGALTPNSKDGKGIVEWDKLSKYWFDLKLSLLRFYREEGFNDKWALLSAELDDVYKHMSATEKARYRYERCLFYIFQLDIPSLRKELDAWRGDISLPYWEAKRAMILAELGDINEAERILETSLQEIRNQLNFYTTITDYLLVSQEAYLLQLLKGVNQSNSRLITHLPIQKYEEYSDRWKDLLQYNCDPWGELQLFEANILKGESAYYCSEKRIYKFDIGGYSTTRRIGSYNKTAQEAYSFLRYIEEIGIALKLPNLTFAKETAQKAIEALSGYSSIWAYSTLIRTGEKKIIDSVFDRKSLSFMTREYVETIANNYLDILNKYVSGYNSYRNKNDVFASSLTTVIPEILSRLCFKCSFETRMAMFEVARKIIGNGRGILIEDNNIEQFVEKILESFTTEEKRSLITQLVEFPIAVNQHDNNADVFRPLTTDSAKASTKVQIKAHIISVLLADSVDGNKRRVAISRLMILYNLGLLTQQQTKLFAKNLWKETNEKGFPKNTNYYYSAWLHYPHPAEVNPLELLRKYINTEPFPIESRKAGNGIGFHGGNLPLPINIANTGKGDNVTLYKWNREDINSLIPKLKEWWDEDKKYLKDTDFHFIDSAANEFKKRFKRLIEIFRYVIKTNITLIDKGNTSKLESIIDDLHNYDFPDLQLKLSVLSLFPAKREDIETDIYKGLCSKNRESIYDAIEASLMLNEEGGSDITDIVNVISDNILCRTDVALDLFIYGIRVILKKKPTVFNESILLKIEIGLVALLMENMIKFEDTQELAHNKLIVRRNIARLTPVLASYFITQKKDMPSYVSEWEKRLVDENEFIDITNAFLESRI
jgi:hypothetical protein